MNANVLRERAHAAEQCLGIARERGNEVDVNQLIEHNLTLRFFLIQWIAKCGRWTPRAKAFFTKEESTAKRVAGGYVPCFFSIFRT